MSDDASPSEAENKPSDLDLTGLGGLSLGPDWGTGSIPPSKTPKTRDRDDRRGGPGGFKRQGGGGGRDRRGGKTARRFGGDERAPAGRRFEGGPRERRGGGGGFRRDSAPPFEPILKADFYPDDAAFKALTQAIKHSCRTFELFEIARLILEKPERWVCVARHPSQKEGDAAILHAAVPDGLPFHSEQEALNHVFNHYLDQFFEIEEYEAEPPSGSFQMIHRCGMTGELIGPPNFHRYQTMLREHHANHLAHVPFEKVVGRLESVREQEVIDAWLEQMKKGHRYTLKQEDPAASPIVMEDFESARFYLLTHAKEKLVRPAYSVRFLGKDLHLLPPGDTLRRSIEALHEHQMRFPLETANNLRGRLRRLNLAVYKRGSKGVSFVCAVKRRFREPGEVLAENLADLIAFLEAHPNTKAAELPNQYLGISAGGTPAPDAEESSETSDGEATPAPAETAEKVRDTGGLDQLKRDLRYLVTQGYVVEFSDGRLQVPPPREPAAPSKKKAERKPSGPAREASESTSTPAAESPVAESPTAEAPKPETSSEAAAPSPGTAPATENPAEPEPEAKEAAPPTPAAELTPSETPAETTPIFEEAEPASPAEPPAAETVEVTPVAPTAETIEKTVPVESETEAAPEVKSEAIESESAAPEISEPAEDETVKKELPVEPPVDTPTEPGSVRPRGESEPEA